MAAKTNAKRSSHANERGPKAADQKGVQGHTLALSIIAYATVRGEVDAKFFLTRKGTLKALEQFRDNAEHIEFRKELEAKSEAIKGDAEKAKISLNAYCDANPVAASVRVECSLWSKMSSAVEKGFSGSAIDYDKPWAEISKAATAHLDNMKNSTGAPAAGAKVTNAGPKARKGRPAKTVVEKAKEFVKTNLVNDKGIPLAKDNRNLAEAVGVLCGTATVEELDEVLAVVSRLREMAVKVREDAAQRIKNASDSAKAQHDAATKGKGRKGAPTPTSPADVLIAKGKELVAAYDPKTDSRTPSGKIVKNLKPSAA